MIEHEFSCPYCGEIISMVLDLSAGGQEYVEDCEVCCRPIQIAFGVEEDALGWFNAQSSSM